MAGRRSSDKAALSLFSEVLREARRKAGLSSDELGAKLGYSGALIRSIESGHRTPQPDFALRRMSSSACRRSSRRRRSGCGTCRSR
jgi:ribosome-binding protein aMBF1 (putative translation factor)